MSETSPNTHYCPRCGAQLADQVDTCPSCGQALCPACGAQIAADAMSCPSCGVAFEAACPECGALVNPEDVSCAQCGAQFQPAIVDITPALTQAEQLQQSYLFALNQLRSKTPPDQVEEQLITSGVTVLTSRALVGTLQATRRQADRATGKRSMLLGGLWTVGGLAITLLGQSLAGERGGSYFILWGAVILGALQFVGGLRQFLANAPAQGDDGAQPEVDPVMVASGYVWPMPQQSKLAWIGVIAFLGIMALLSFSSLGAPLIDKAAAQVNLTAADVGSGYTLAEDSGTETFSDKDLRDASRRVLQSGDSFVQATVLVWKQRVGDSPLALLTAFDKQIRQDTSVTAKFETPHTVTVGPQSGALESFQLTAQGRTLQGYLLAFIRDNVMVLVLEVGVPGTVTEQQILSHAQLIDQRLQ
jgi:hypothetical protein